MKKQDQYGEARFHWNLARSSGAVLLALVVGQAHLAGRLADMVDADVQLVFYCRIRYPLTIFEPSCSQLTCRLISDG